SVIITALRRGATGTRLPSLRAILAVDGAAVVVEHLAPAGAGEIGVRGGRERAGFGEAGLGIEADAFGFGRTDIDKRHSVAVERFLRRRGLVESVDCIEPVIDDRLKIGIVEMPLLLVPGPAEEGGHAAATGDATQLHLP